MPKKRRKKNPNVIPLTGKSMAELCDLYHQYTGIRVPRFRTLSQGREKVLSARLGFATKTGPPGQRKLVRNYNVKPTGIPVQPTKGTLMDAVLAAAFQKPATLNHLRRAIKAHDRKKGVETDPDKLTFRVLRCLRRINRIHGYGVRYDDQSTIVEFYL